jgi:hypothetical protein
MVVMRLFRNGGMDDLVGSSLLVALGGSIMLGLGGLVGDGIASSLDTRRVLVMCKAVGL